MSKLRLVPSAGGTRLEIDSNKVVGRDASADVVVDDASVSRKHARIERTGEAWSVADQASANGTFLNGQRVTEAGLRHGQTLRFGDVSFTVEIEGREEDLAATRLGAALPSLPTAPAVTAKAPFASPSPKKGKGPVFWIGGCCGCLLLLALLVGILGLVGAIAIPSFDRFSSKSRGGASAPADRPQLRLDVSGPTKTKDGKATKVEVVLTVTGYGTRPSQGRYELDLQEDLVTLNSEDIRIDDLSKVNIERRQAVTTSAEGEPQVFSTTLTISSLSPGRYSIRLTITDLVTGATVVKNVPFTLP